MVLQSRHCERSEAIHSFFVLRHGLLRGVYHRARIRATRWLAMTARELSFCRVGKGALFAPCPPSLKTIIVNGGHASALPTLRKLIPVVRQHRQRRDFDALVDQRAGLVRRGLAVDRAMLDIAVMHL